MFRFVDLIFMHFVMNETTFLAHRCGREERFYHLRGSVRNARIKKIFCTSFFSDANFNKRNLQSGWVMNFLRDSIRHFKQNLPSPRSAWFNVIDDAFRWKISSNEKFFISLQILPKSKVWQINLIISLLQFPNVQQQPNALELNKTNWINLVRHRCN